MAREKNRLTVRTVSSLKEPGRYSDGDRLYLQIGPTGTKSWLFMYSRNGKRTEMGLGSIDTVPLAEARQRAEDARRTLAEGHDPLKARKAAQMAARAQEEAVTFGPFADALVKDLTKGFHNAVHRAQWEMTLGPAYCASIRDKRLDEITTDDILAVLKPIWTQKAETASRLRGRLERVLDAARVKGLRTGENPARWKGHLDTLLPRRQKLQRGHHAALPYRELPPFMASLKEGTGRTEGPRRGGTVRRVPAGNERVSDLHPDRKAAQGRPALAHGDRQESDP